MVDTLDEDLDIENDGEEAKGEESKEAAEEKKNKDAASADAEDEVQVEENEDTKADAEEEGSKTPEANESEAIKDDAPIVPKHDYTLIDTLSEFLYSDEEPLAILCGYFLKVME